jgi:hypothetical protein
VNEDQAHTDMTIVPSATKNWPGEFGRGIGGRLLHAERIRSLRASIFSL